MKKCIFAKKCKLYSEVSVTCNLEAGMYYGDGTRPAGCYRKIMEEKKKCSD